MGCNDYGGGEEERVRLLELQMHQSSVLGPYHIKGMIYRACDQSVLTLWN